MVRNDSELLTKLAVDLGLDDGDIAYLLGAAVDSEAVQRIVAQARGSGQATDAGPKRVGKASRGKGKLADL